jgi:hypothetical protein
MEFGEFKKAFFAGEIIWISGVGEDDEAVLLCELEKLQVQPSCVEFTDMREIVCREGLLPGNGFEVLAVRLGSGLHPAQVRAGVRALKQLKEIQHEQGFRVILISAEFQSEWSRELGVLGAWNFTLPLHTAESILDRAVHGLIEMASLHAEVRVSRLTEKAAFFLEESVKTSVDGELVALVVLGLKRSDGKVLRFRDLLPNFHRHFEGGDQGETV